DPRSGARPDREGQRAEVIRDRVDEPVISWELPELSPLGEHVDDRVVVVEVDLVAVPAQLPGDHDRNQVLDVLIGTDAHLRGAQRPRDTRDAARVLAGVEHIGRALGTATPRAHGDPDVSFLATPPGGGAEDPSSLARRPS